MSEEKGERIAPLFLTREEAFSIIDEYCVEDWDEPLTNERVETIVASLVPQLWLAPAEGEGAFGATRLGGAPDNRGGIMTHLARQTVNTLIETPGCDPASGSVQWDPVHSLWNGSMLLIAVVLGPLTFSMSAFAIFIVLTGATLLLGHSVGFHRRLIHRSFKCPRWLERALVWCGTLVGMSGPFWMIQTHDLRDWAQRQSICHDYLAHRRPMLIDAWWQLHCRLDLSHPPRFNFGAAGRDPFYAFLERTWMAQQIPVAIILFAVGGWNWVVWGVCVRVTVSVTGHWFIGHLAHRVGPQSWLVDGAGVQAHDVPWAAVPAMGEAWHNNHHAFPGSARIGLYPGQSDWGYLFIRVLERVGLAWSVILPEDLPERHELRWLGHDHESGRPQQPQRGLA